MIKLMIAVKRRPGMSRQAFRQHLSVKHADLVKRCPATEKYVRKYVQSYTLIDEAAAVEPMFDGAAELWFDSAEAMANFFNDADYLAQVRPDESQFADMGKTVFFVTEECQVV